MSKSAKGRVGLAPIITLLITLGGTAMTHASPPLSYLALGDSYTIGESVEAHERWPVRLAERLRKAGIDMAEPRIIATTGWTVDELSAAMDQADLQPDWDVVSLLIGVNNAYRGRPVEDFASEYQAMLERAIALAGGRPNRVIVLSIPDWSKTPFAERSGRDLEAETQHMADYNRTQRDITLARGVAWFDITPSTLEMASDPLWVADDGLHPSAALYQRWVREIEEQVAALLRTAQEARR